MAETALRITDLSKKYGDFQALSGLNLEVNTGEIVGLLGPNGAGKTTTIKLITGLLRPDSGSILIKGIDIAQQPVQAKKKFALVPDVPYLYGKLTGWEFMHFIAVLYGVEKKNASEKIDSQLKVFNLWGVCHDLIDSYSHGMKQRLLLASVMMRDPELIILDEPMVGLDPEASRMVKNIFLDLASKDRTIFLSTHTLSDARELCGRIAVIAGGKLIAYGTYEELQKLSGSAGSLEDVYMAITANA